MASKVRSIPKSNQNFLFCPDSKIENFIQKNLPPHPPKNRKNGGGGIFIKCCLIQKSLNMTLTKITKTQYELFFLTLLDVNHVISH